MDGKQVGEAKGPKTIPFGYSADVGMDAETPVADARSPFASGR